MNLIHLLPPGATFRLPGEGPDEKAVVYVRTTQGAASITHDGRVGFRYQTNEFDKVKLEVLSWGVEA